MTPEPDGEEAVQVVAVGPRPESREPGRHIHHSGGRRGKMGARILHIVGMALQEGEQALVPFLWLETADRVNQGAAGAHERRRARQQGVLEPGEPIQRAV